MIPIKAILRALLESEIESKKQYNLNEPVFAELCEICDEIEKSSVFWKAHGFDVEIDQDTKDTIISLRFTSAISYDGTTNRIKLL